MQHLDNHMDDLFQRAAKEYPIKDPGSDWEKIAKQLSQKEGREISPVKEKSWSKKLLGMLLLLCILVIGFSVYESYNEQPKKLVKHSPDPLHTSQAEGIPINNQKPKPETERKISGTKILANNKNNPVKFPVIPDQHPARRKVLEMMIPYGAGHSNAAALLPSEPSFSSESTYGLSLGSYIFNNISSTMPAKKIFDQKSAGNIKPSIELRVSETLIKSQLNEKEKSSTRNTVHKKMYIGIAAGPDFSKVKQKSYGTSGMGVGILAGLPVGKKWAFESGFYWDKKLYSSAGSYFRMDKVGPTMPAGMVVDKIDGRSSLLEIPIKLRYNAIHEKKSLFFITAGASAYIMLNEKNSYSVTYNGASQKMEGQYSAMSYDAPAAAGFSLGYEHPVSNYFNIRIEPYLKIPLRGIGVGQLPISSAGVQIGISRKLK